MLILLVVFILLTLWSVESGSRNYNILSDSSREWDSSLQTITVEGLCFPEHCGRDVNNFDGLTVELQLFDGATELNAPTVRITLFIVRNTPPNLTLCKRKKKTESRKRDQQF